MIQVIHKPVAAANWRQGSAPRAVRAIVLHVAEGSEPAVDSWFNNGKAIVSAHFLVGLDGELRQYVGIHDVAYHAGQAINPVWPGFVSNNTNATTIGIEHEGGGLTPWPEPQMLTSSMLSAWLCNRFEPVTGLKPDKLHFPLHSEIKATKPFCPGKFFDRDDYLARAQWWRRSFSWDELHNMIRDIT